MNNTENMVSVPREWLSAYLEDDAAMVVVDGELTSLWELLTTAATQPAKQHQGKPDEYPPCDYCEVVPDHHPWHGSGLLNGVENRHIHACDACRGRLPLHPGQHQDEPVERDERALFEANYVEWFNRKYNPTEPLTTESMVASRRGDNYGTGSLGRNGKWEGWQARAALDRKQ